LSAFRSARWTRSSMPGSSLNSIGGVDRFPGCLMIRRPNLTIQANALTECLLLEGKRA
jgi:hypothetical protein